MHESNTIFKVQLLRVTYINDQTYHICGVDQSGQRPQFLLYHLTSIVPESSVMFLLVIVLV